MPKLKSFLSIPLSLRRFARISYNSRIKPVSAERDDVLVFSENLQYFDPYYNRNFLSCDDTISFRILRQMQIEIEKHFSTKQNHTIANTRYNTLNQKNVITNHFDRPNLDLFFRTFLYQKTSSSINFIKFLIKSSSK